jgi:hypothetical protein
MTWDGEELLTCLQLWTAFDKHGEEHVAQEAVAGEVEAPAQHSTREK